MATPKTFIPMVSASPPPLDGFDDDEEDDFGSFASAGFSPEKQKPALQNDAHFFPIKEAPQDSEDNDDEFGNFSSHDTNNHNLTSCKQTEDLHNDVSADLEFGTFPSLKTQSHRFGVDSAADVSSFTAFHGFTNGREPNSNQNDNSWGNVHTSDGTKAAAVPDDDDEFHVHSPAGVTNDNRSGHCLDQRLHESKDETSDNHSRNSENTNSSNSYSDDLTPDFQSPFTSDSHSQDTDSSDFQSFQAAKREHLNSQLDRKTHLPESRTADTKSQLELFPERYSNEVSSEDFTGECRNIDEPSTRIQAECFSDGEFGDFSSVNTQDKETPPTSSLRTADDWLENHSELASESVKPDCPKGTDGLFDGSQSPKAQADDWGDFDSVPASSIKSTETTSEFQVQDATNDDGYVNHFESFKEKPPSDDMKPDNGTFQPKIADCFSGFGAFQDGSSLGQETKPTVTNTDSENACPLPKNSSQTSSASVLEEEDFGDFGDFGAFKEGNHNQATSFAAGDFQAFGERHQEDKDDFGGFSSSFDSASTTKTQVCS